MDGMLSQEEINALLGNMDADSTSEEAASDAVQTSSDISKAEKLTPYVDKVSDEPLMKEIPKGGKIISEQKDDVFGTTMLTLSNGVKVIIKKTDFKADEITMKGVSLGGSSLFPNSEIININGLDAVQQAV